MKILAAALMMLAIAGCASSQNEITSQRSASDFPEGNGVIVGSFTSSEERYSRSFRFRSLDGNGIDQALSFTSMWPRLYDNSLYAFSLPPGRYEFYDFRIAGGTGYYWTAKEEFTIPFSVNKGEVAYLGEIRMMPVWGKNIFGITIPDGGYFIVTDIESRDVPKLKAEYPDLNWTGFQNRTLKDGDVPEQLVRFVKSGD